MSALHPIAFAAPPVTEVAKLLSPGELGLTVVEAPREAGLWQIAAERGSAFAPVEEMPSVEGRAYGPAARLRLLPKPGYHGTAVLRFRVLRRGGGLGPVREAVVLVSAALPWSAPPQSHLRDCDVQELHRHHTPEQASSRAVSPCVTARRIASLVRQAEADDYPGWIPNASVSDEAVSPIRQ
ncbi:MAG: hypothetical protein AAFV96_00845 [Pseudomonadota bacterium]